MTRHALLIAALALGACAGGNRDDAAGDTAGGAVAAPGMADTGATGAAGGTGGTGGTAGTAGTTGAGATGGATRAGDTTGAGGTAQNQTQSGVTNTKTGQSTLGPNVKSPGPTQGTGTQSRDTTRRPPR